MVFGSSIKKRAPRAGESCIFKMNAPRIRERHFAKQGDLQIDPRKQKVHRAEAIAQLPKKCAPRAGESAGGHLQTCEVLRTARETIEFYQLR